MIAGFPSFTRGVRQDLSRIAIALAGLVATAGALGANTAAPIDFNRHIRPIFSDNCFACHGPDENKRKAGLRLDLREAAFKKLDSGERAIVSGKPEQSALLKVISLPSEHDDHMPPVKTGKHLSTAQIDLLRRWIEQGARWAEHWSYIAPERPAVPSLRAPRSAIQNPIDAFVLARLKEKGLKQNQEADRAALIRRVTLDLTGLPPTIEEVDAFLADRNPDAYETVVDRLLASPHFGERLALAWLDQARYADTAGYHFDGFRQMHHWRDWVIKAFNDNKPFDQFTIEQLAGDLLPNATIDQKIATGFNRNVMTTDEGGVDPEEYMTKYQVDRVSTTAQVWLGTTLGCAECHDHKYDPLTQREFYRFYAFFNGIPEKGKDGTRVKNPAPVLRLPTVEQGSRLLTFDEKIPAAEKAQSDREGELPKAQEKWEKELAEVKAPEIAGLIKAFSFEGGDLETNQLVPGKIGKALALNGGTNEFVEAGQAVGFEFTNSFSYGAWIKLQGATGTVLSKMEEGPGYRGFDLLISKGKIEVHLAHKFPDNAIKIVSKEALRTNVWTHLLVTYDGSKKAAGVKVYVDGGISELDRPSDKLTASIATDAPLLIGTRARAFPFDGLIDDLRFYDRALKTNEVVELVAYPYLLVAQLPAEQRSKEQREELKKFFRENRAVDFLAARVRTTELKEAKKKLLEEIPDTMVMEEMEKPRDTFILVRGSYQNKGEKVTPGTPECWPPLPAGEPANRLALARWLVATNNPLTARVTVNRLWSMFFGTGLVKTANDFGSQGERPSHPDLLDWLACEFMQGSEKGEVRGEKGDVRGERGEVRGGKGTSPLRPLTSHLKPLTWNTKHLVRLIVTSATYRQSAVVSAAKLERDPYNRLLSRGPRVRLDAEFIRDNALAASGLLNAAIGGPSVKPYQPPGLWEITDHKFEPSKGQDLYRRGLYVLWKRAVHYPSFATFDAPSREICTLQRQRTSTPLQSLVIMNDPVYVEAARALAARALREGGLTLRGQLAHAFRLVLARSPRPDELKVLERTFREHHERFTRDKASAEALLSIGESPQPLELDTAILAAMSGVANVLLNLNETITK
jgi:mono/diheme cytochrome c family protein